jgi:hypothetical protein
VIVKRIAGSAALVVVALAVLAPPTGAQQPTTADPTADIALTFQETWSSDGEPLALGLDISRLTRGDRIDVVVDVRRAVRNQREFDASLDGGLPSQRVMTPTTQHLVDLPVDPAGARLLNVALPSLAPGVYPVSVTLRDRERGEVLDRLITHIVRVSETVVQPLRVAWVQPLSAPPTHRPDGEIAVDPETALDLTRLATTISATPTVPMTLDITPETLASLQTTNPETAAAIRTAARGRNVIAAPYVNVDPTALVAAGLGADLSSQRVAGEAVLREITGGPGDPRTWSSESALSPAAAGQLHLMGVSQVVVPAADLSAINADSVDGRSLDRPFDLDAEGGQTIGAVTADEALSKHFVDDGDRVLAAHQLLADLAVRHDDWPGITRGVVLRPPADWKPDAVFAGIVLMGLADATMVRPVTVEGLFAEVPRLTRRNRAETRTADTEPRQSLTTLPVTEARLAIDGLGALTTGAVGQGVDLARQVLIAESSDLSMAQRRAYLDDIFDRTRSVQAGIRLVGGRTFRLAGRSGTIPLTLVNDNDFPAVVTVELTSEKLEFDGGIGTDRSTRVFESIELGPKQRTVIPVDVRARASAAFSMRAVLRTPGTGDELGRGRFTVISPAVPNVGIALSVGAGLFLLVWWIRNWRTTRRTALIQAANPVPVDTEHATS